MSYYSASCPRMLLHGYTEPQWLLPPASESSSLDRLDTAEASHWDAVRTAVLPETNHVTVLGMASDEAKSFGLQATTEPVDVTVPESTISLHSWVQKYHPKVQDLRRRRPRQQKQQR